jgi:hypothetical protein
MIEKYYPLLMNEVKPSCPLTHARGCEYHKFVMGDIGFEPKSTSPCRSKKISHG